MIEWLLFAADSPEQYATTVDLGAGCGLRQGEIFELAVDYASVLLDSGENIKVLAEYLGHSDPGFTLRTYTHLMPNSRDRARRAIDSVFGKGVSGTLSAKGRRPCASRGGKGTADGPQTAQGSGCPL